MDKVTDIDSPSRRKRVARRRPTPSMAEYWDKAEKAYDLKIAGKSLSEIAGILDIKHKDDVIRLLQERYAYDAAYLDDQSRKNILHMEMLRLDKLQAAVWDSAMMGDPKSVDAALKVIQTRARIVGLEKVDPVVQKNLVLVMGEKEDEYIAALKAAGATGED